MKTNEFKGMVWKNSVNVSDFILNNFTSYDGDQSFLQGATARTSKVAKKVATLVKQERENGGVLDVDTVNVTTLKSHKPGYIMKSADIIVGLQTDAPLKRSINPFGGLRTCKQACEAYGYELDSSVVDAFKFLSTHNDGVFSAYTAEMKAARKAGILTGLPDAYGRGRLIGDYRRVALYGMEYLINQKMQDKIELGKKDMLENNVRLLEELSGQIAYMNDLIEMASGYGFDISKPATNAKEAIQWLYFAYLGSVKEQNGAANSIGRISTFIDIYIERDINKGILSEEQAQEMIDDFVLKLRLVRHLRTPDYNVVFAGDPTWVTISEGGCTSKGKHMVTKTSFRVLNTLYNLGPCSEPNITILWSDKLPENYKKFCAQVSIDTDSIQYENDDLMRKDYGDDYGIACCVSAMKLGKQQQLFGARCNLPKVLLMALNGGKDEVYGTQLAFATPKFGTEVLNYNKVYASYKKYVAWLAKLYVNTLSLIHFMHDKYAYEKLTMALHDTDPERLMAFGVCGLSVVADSLSAIKYAKVTPIKDERGIIVDFDIQGDFPKYGNDDNRVDKIAKQLLNEFITELKKTPAYRNAKHTLSVLTITSNVMYGKKTGSTPDGRKKGQPFAPGANPMHGRDCCGALASLNSVAKMDFNDCKDGVSNTFTIVPSVLGEDKPSQISRLVSVINGYFKKNAQHLNVNVLNPEMLMDAMDKPEKYPNLTIRVSGYAVMFNKLTKEQQLEVISRTFHEKI